MRALPLLAQVVAIVVLSLHAASAQMPAPPAATVTHSVTLPPTAGPEAAGGTVQFIGTATVLVRYQGLTILTAPNFLHKGEHVHLGYGLHAQRLTNPALSLAQLPPVDVVLLSHLHEDHFDQLVQQTLKRDTLIVTTPEAAPSLRHMGFRRALGLSTWEALELRKGDARLLVTAMPGRHGPPLAAALLPAVMGTMLDFAALHTQPRYRIYITGDTLVFDDIAQIPRRFPGIDLALLHLGGTRILNMVKVTMDGKDGVAMLRLIAPAQAIPIHFNDYDVFKSPLQEFQHEVDAARLSTKVIYLEHGATYHFQE